MKGAFSLSRGIAIVSLVFFFASLAGKFQARAADNAIVSRDAEVEGIKLHT